MVLFVCVVGEPVLCAVATPDDGKRSHGGWGAESAIAPGGSEWSLCRRMGAAATARKRAMSEPWMWR